MAAKKQRLEGVVDPVVSRVEDDDDSDTDMEGRPGEEYYWDSDSSEDESPEVIERTQTTWVAEQAIKYYNRTHQVEYVLIEPVCSTGFILPQVGVCHCLFTAKNVSSSSWSSSGSSPPAPKVDDSGSSSSTPRLTPDCSGSSSEVVASYGSGSSSSSRSLTLCPDVELFFAESALYPSSKLDELTIHCCAILGQRGPVPSDVGCFYCSKAEKKFYHPPKEQLKYCYPDVQKLEYDDPISSP